MRYLVCVDCVMYACGRGVVGWDLRCVKYELCVNTEAKSEDWAGRCEVDLPLNVTGERGGRDS